MMLLDKVDDACRVKQEEDWPKHRALRYTKSQRQTDGSFRLMCNRMPTVSLLIYSLLTSIALYPLQ